MQFMKLTRSDGVDVFVNFGNVVAVFENGENTMIVSNAGLQQQPYQVIVTEKAEAILGSLGVS